MRDPSAASAAQDDTVGGAPMTGLMAHRLRAAIVDVRPNELRALGFAFVFHFIAPSSFYVLRPIRDEIGAAGGVENLAWMFTGTLAVTLVANVVFSWLVVRWPRRQFIPIVYRFLIFNLLVFFVLMRALPGESQLWLSRAFFAWVSAFNLFVVTVFWAFMTDVFRTEQAKRLFCRESRGPDGVLRAARCVGECAHNRGADFSDRTAFEMARGGNDAGSAAAISLIGFAAIGITPALGLFAVFQVLRRGMNYAVSRPAREVLFTVLRREDKYKAKSFIDTFVYRAGDQVGAWSYTLLGWLGLGLTGISFVALPLAAAWCALSVWLGRKQMDLARERALGDLPASVLRP